VYYNIKINYNKSEFALNSLDKDIIEREMDLYFAFFVDAGDEFVSKIKKIQNVHPKIKPIDDIVSSALNNKENISSEVFETAIKNNSEIENKVQNVVEKISEEPQKSLELVNESALLKSDFNVVEQQKEIPTPTEEKNNNQNLKEDIFNNNIKPLNENKNFEIINKEKQIQHEVQKTHPTTYEQLKAELDKDDEITKKYGFDELEPNLPPEYNKIQEMIKLAQNKINSIDLNNNNVSENPKLNEIFTNNDEIAIEKPSEIEEKPLIQDEVKNTKQEIVNDIFANNDEIAIEKPSEIEEKPLIQDEAKNAKQEIVNDIFANSEDNLELEGLKIEKPFIIQQPTETELREFAQNLDNAIAQSIAQTEQNSEIDKSKMYDIPQVADTYERREIDLTTAPPIAPDPVIVEDNSLIEIESEDDFENIQLTPSIQKIEETEVPEVEISISPSLEQQIEQKQEPQEVALEEKPIVIEEKPALKSDFEALVESNRLQNQPIIYRCGYSGRKFSYKGGHT